jgi:UDP-2,4-diacetamido-2,4,6-trideoxy-beta-L-altropyranose hydrolase
MNVTFRVDSSMEIGTGHVMRCLTLANKIKFKGGGVTFICRDHEGHICSTIKEQGHSIIMLPLSRSDNNSSDTSSGFVEKLGNSLEGDAVETINAINDSNPDWLVVDNYEVDSVWHKKLIKFVKKILVIDDVPGKLIYCDILLNQNYGYNLKDYNGLVPITCQLLLGPTYALLRPQFNNWRDEAFVKRSKTNTIKNILIGFGGLDTNNLTSLVLDALETLEQANFLEVNVVLGEHAPHLESLSVRKFSNGIDVKIHSNVLNMAELMCNADISIGAAGSTSWERCCLGLPTIIISLAPNQDAIVEELESLGVAIKINSIKAIKDILINVFDKLLEPEAKLLKGISKKAFNVCDGLGVERVLEKMNN